MRGEGGKETPRKEMDNRRSFFDVTLDTFCCHLAN